MNIVRQIYINFFSNYFFNTNVIKLFRNKKLVVFLFFLPFISFPSIALAAPKILRYSMNSDPYSMNPMVVTDSGLVLHQIYEGLMTVDKNGKLAYGVAQSYKRSKDGLKYTFKLRKNAKWSNGDPVIAADFEYAWKWILNPKNNSAVMNQLFFLKNARAYSLDKTKNIEDVGVKAIDSHTLEVRLEHYTPYLLKMFNFYTLPVNSKVAKRNPNWVKNELTSNGAFYVKQWKRGNKVTLVKNPHYWDAKNVKLDGIDFIIVRDENTALQMFNKGELDYLSSIPSEALDVLKSKKMLRWKRVPGTYWTVFNVTKLPFNNANFRKALTLAVNRRAIVDHILGTGQIPAMANIPPTMFPENKKGYFRDNDIVGAKRYLKQAMKEMGISDVSELPKLIYSYSNGERNQKIAMALQDMWKRNLGINVNLENFEWNVYLDKMRSHDLMMGRAIWYADFDDPINFMDIFYADNSNQGYPGWEGKDKFKMLVDKSRKELDAKKRKKILRSAEATMMEAMPLMPIYYYSKSWAQNPSLQGVVIDSVGSIFLQYSYYK